MRQSSIGELFGVDQTVVSGWKSGKGDIGIATAKRAQASHGIRAAFVLLGEGPELLDDLESDPYELGRLAGRLELAATVEGRVVQAVRDAVANASGGFTVGGSGTATVGGGEPPPAPTAPAREGVERLVRDAQQAPDGTGSESAPAEEAPPARSARGRRKGRG